MHRRGGGFGGGVSDIGRSWSGGRSGARVIGHRWLRSAAAATTPGAATVATTVTRRGKVGVPAAARTAGGWSAGAAGARTEGGAGAGAAVSVTLVVAASARTAGGWSGGVSTGLDRRRVLHWRTMVPGIRIAFL